MAGEKNSDNTQFGRASADGTRAGGGAATVAAGDGVEPLVDLEGRPYVRAVAGNAVPPGTSQLQAIASSTAGAIGFTGRVMKYTGIVDAVCFVQIFDQAGVPVGGEVPRIQVQQLAPGNFEIDLTAIGGVAFVSGGFAYGFSTTRDTYTAGLASGIGYLQAVT